MLEREREAVAVVRRTPGLVLWGSGAVVAVLCAYAVGRLVTIVLGLATWVVAWPLASALTTLLVPFPMAGLYVVAREAAAAGDGECGVGDASGGDGDAGDGATGNADEPGPPGRWPFRRLLAASVANYPRLLGASVVAWLVGLALQVPVFLVLLSGQTAVDYVLYAGGANHAPPWGSELLVVLVLLVAASQLARLPLVFYDLPVLDGRQPPSRGWLSSVGFAVARPRRLVRYGLGRTLLFVPPVAVLAAAVGVPALLVGDVASAAVALIAGAVALLGLVATVLALFASATLVAVYHVLAYDEVVAPVATSRERVVPRPTRRQLAAAAAVVVVLVAAVGGAMAVRVTDVRPNAAGEPDPVGPDESPAAIIDGAREQVHTTSHREETTIVVHNTTSGEHEGIARVVVEIDRRDRQLRSTTYPGNGTDPGFDRFAVYGSERTFAITYLQANETVDPSEVGPEVRLNPLLRVEGVWGVIPAPRYERLLRDDFGPGQLPERDGWRVLDRTDDRVVLGWRDRSPSEEGVVDRRVRVVVDANTGRPRRVVSTETTVHRGPDGSVRGRLVDRTTTTYGGWGTTDDVRPEPLGDPGPLEWLWDLVYY